MSLYQANSFLKAGWWFLAVLGLILGLNTLTYLNFNSSYGFLRLKQEAVASGLYLPFYYAHVLVGGLILIVGFFQFSRSMRGRWLRVHKLAGRFYVFGILLFAAPGGLVMSFFIGRGPLVLLSFLLQCSLWFYFTTMAFRMVRSADIRAHECWMFRSFALTLAAITLRVYIFIASWWIDLNHPYAYALLAWLSWLPNLFFAEWLFKKRQFRASD
jgi:hypothetical protein